jgi:hypothetical protein
MVNQQLSIVRNIEAAKKEQAYGHSHGGQIIVE